MFYPECRYFQRGERHGKYLDRWSQASLSPLSHVAGIGAGIELEQFGVTSADHGGGKGRAGICGKWGIVKRRSGLFQIRDARR